MNTKKWIFIFIGISFILLGTVVGINYLIDPYGYFRTPIIKGINDNKINGGWHSCLKKELIENYKGKELDLIFGTSRSAVYRLSNNFINLSINNSKL